MKPTAQLRYNFSEVVHALRWLIFVSLDGSLWCPSLVYNQPLLFAGFLILTILFSLGMLVLARCCLNNFAGQNHARQLISVIMPSRHYLKITIITVIAALAGFSSAQAQQSTAANLASGSRHGTEPIVTTGSPAGLIKKVEPEYPIGFVLHGAKGRGHFRMTINAKSGLVEQYDG